jgi:hypothetical protein
MVAIADPEKMPEWAERGLKLADFDLEASYWAGPRPRSRLALRDR